MFDAIDDTIVAVASPPGVAGRGIVRCSGPQSLAIAARLLHPAPPADARGFRRVAGEVLLDDGCRVPGELYVFRAPRSYTRQDCVELHVPGSPALLGMLVQRIVALGARPAEPGEFTARAFLAGAMDLAQAEAVERVVRAGSDTQLRAARRMMEGRLGVMTAEAMERVAELVALVEADIDFAEEPIEFITPSELADRLGGIAAYLDTLCATSASSERIDVLPRVLLLGRSNAGKSTLMNRLSGVDRAICSPVAGTTRDVLSAAARMGDYEVLLLDAAGVDTRAGGANTTDADADTGLDALMIEAGRITFATAATVDLVCFVVDVSIDRFAQDVTMLHRLGDAPAVVMANKIDVLSADERCRRLAALRDQAGRRVCAVSAVTGEGIEACVSMICETLHAPASADASDVIVLTARQRHAIDTARKAIRRAAAEAATAHETSDRADTLAFELREALDVLGSVCGRMATDDLLTRVFASFCIGK